MNRPYFSLFANFFLTLVISRPNFRGLAQYTLDALKQAREAGRLDGAKTLFEAVIAELEAAIAKFDTTLNDRKEPTTGDTEAFRQARKALLDWVQAQQVKIINPAFYGKPVYQDFRLYTRGKLAALNQETLMVDANKLVGLYTANAAALEPRYALEYPTPAGQPAQTMVQRATALVADLRAADSARDSGDIAISTSITVAKSDWVTLATTLRRAKGLLEFTFATDEEVYTFFDFSKAKPTSKQKKADAATPAPPAEG